MHFAYIWIHNPDKINILYIVKRGGQIQHFIQMVEPVCPVL
jgi:hypothetical protein